MAIPKDLQPKYDEVAPLIINFCDVKLNTEFKEICLRLLEKLCRKRPSPLVSGKARTWAAGIIYAIGQNNFIFDKSQEYSMTAAELAEPFGVASSTAANKAAEIRKYVKISYMTPEWLLKEITDSSPLTWMLEVNGLLVDIRMMPLTVQRQAYARGLIPYVPSDKNDTTIAGAQDEPTTSDDKAMTGQAFEFMILLDMYDFEIWRKVVIPANITFKQLHYVIQSSFSWMTYHLFDFGIYDNSAEGMMVAMISDDPHSADYIEEVKIYPLKTKITTLLPKYNRVLYTYDYGDDWQHRCELVNVIENYPHDFPKCIDGKGDAPPEDVGGEPGYADFIKAINDKNNPEHSEMKKWGKSQRFEPFDIKKVNARLKRALSRKH